MRIPGKVCIGTLGIALLLGSAGVQCPTNPDLECAAGRGGAAR